MAVDKKKKPHYVNNKEFLQAMVEWKARCREAEEQGKTTTTNHQLYW